MSKHSPAPWRVVGADGRAQGIWDAEAKDVVPSGPMSLEDARLIAAAPDLLAALKLALTHLSSANWGNKRDNVFTRARDAIEKAEGKP
jgi:hypothetical protein